jgi:uncharacterized protein YgbK (DUF1537 family)
MTEEQYELVTDIFNDLFYKIHNLVDFTLKGNPSVVREAVRTKLNEEFRFWERTPK